MSKRSVEVSGAFTSSMGCGSQFKEFFLSIATNAVFGAAKIFNDGWAAVEVAWTEGELADARREWQEAIAEAARKRKEAEAGEPERMKEFQDSLSFSAEAIGDEQRKVEVKGTFNALAARGLGADSLA